MKELWDFNLNYYFDGFNKNIRFENIENRVAKFYYRDSVFETQLPEILDERSLGDVVWKVRVAFRCVPKGIKPNDLKVLGRREQCTD